MEWFLLRCQEMRVYRDEKDKVLCIESKSGKFLELGDLVSFLMSVIWSSHMPPTVSFFAWKVMWAEA